MNADIASAGVEVVHAALTLPSVKLATASDTKKVVSSYGVVTTTSWGATSAAAEALNIASDSNDFIGTFAHEISKHRCYDRELDGLTSMVAY